MTVTDRDRKILWGRSGNQCAICTRQLVADKTARDRESVVGEEAHIVARAPGGPRGGRIEDHLLDGHENLILLCRVHHKMIDDQPVTYSPQRLAEIKAAHEARVSRSLMAGSPHADPVELVDDPSFGPGIYEPLASGRDVWNVVAGAQAFHIATTDDAGLGSDACDALDEFADTARDYGEISDDVAERRGSVRQAQRHLGELLATLHEHGLVVYGSRERRIVRGGVLPPSYWWLARLAVLRSDDVRKLLEDERTATTEAASRPSDSDPG